MKDLIMRKHLFHLPSLGIYGDEENREISCQRVIWHLLNRENGHEEPDDFHDNYIGRSIPEEVTIEVNNSGPGGGMPIRIAGFFHNGRDRTCLYISFPMLLDNSSYNRLAPEAEKQMQSFIQAHLAVYPYHSAARFFRFNLRAYEGHIPLTNQEPEVELKSIKGAV